MIALGRIETPYSPDWPEPAAWVNRTDVAPAPPLPLDDLLRPALARWVETAAECKGCPADYVLAALLSTASSLIGNSRWTAPWPGWSEPPVLWAMAVGQPSSGKSPGLDAVLGPLGDIERPMRKAAEAEAAVWSEAADLAKTREAAWREQVKAAQKGHKELPERPEGLDPGPAPQAPRLMVQDITIERLGALLARQPRGVLQFRDELAGFLGSMTRYKQASDRPFWLEAYGGRAYAVERVTREPLTIDRLTVAVLGGIQPDRLRSLLLNGVDDGLTARFMPFWPEPIEIRRPTRAPEDGLLQGVLSRLHSLPFATGEDGEARPWYVSFDEPARDMMDAWRRACRDLEAGEDGLLLSFIGKLPGLSARLALVLAFLDWTVSPIAPEPQVIGVGSFGRACHFIESYVLPMARRAYAAGSQPDGEIAAHRLLAILREQRWRTFTSRQVLRLERPRLSRIADLKPALTALEEADAIRKVDQPPGPNGGRPSWTFIVNPAVLERAA